MARVQENLFDKIASEGVHVNKINLFIIIIIFFFNNFFFSLHYGHQ